MIHTLTLSNSLTFHLPLTLSQLPQVPRPLSRCYFHFFLSSVFTISLKFPFSHFPISLPESLPHLSLSLSLSLSIYLFPLFSNFQNPSLITPFSQQPSHSSSRIFRPHRFYFSVTSTSAFRLAHSLSHFSSPAPFSRTPLPISLTHFIVHQISKSLFFPFPFSLSCSFLFLSLIPLLIN